jgi:hypothetical protein
VWAHGGKGQWSKGHAETRERNSRLEQRFFSGPRGPIR